VIEKFLYSDNKHEIRVEGLNLYLLFIDVFKITEKSPVFEILNDGDIMQLETLAHVIDLEVFKWSYGKKIMIRYVYCTAITPTGNRYR
jgi:hypothetical protein